MIAIVEQGADKVGGLSKLAEGLGIKHQAFYSWKKVPAERVLDFERLTGISRHVLRPDVFGPEPGDAPSDAARPGGVAAGPAIPQAGTGHPHQREDAA
ncbi:helix-turn-helix domain-containing protein [Mesorhizobium sp. B2-5-9]|uniref:Cro/CI family transcriptional regulator n=1 Tax=Mesorhizobium sp. B2-5-9 TaxID=2589921 RepID=UPI001126A290|nr:helix-turn-helix domain-containing protein [Mesorhizobium sp. B2-5-9]